ncbi:MAG: hypothetical protein DA330_02015 [Nitrososphaera sp.]|nr:hypothetical protein [Nitrososphaera sp.]
MASLQKEARLMTSDLHDAFTALGLKAGTSWDEVKEKHQILAAGLHPDTYKGKRKEKAETELKKINHARDVLRKHFQEDHKESGCACDPNPTASHTGPAPSPDATQQHQDDVEQRAAEARRRDAQRAQEAEEARRAAEAQAQAAAAATAQRQEEAQFAQDLQDSYQFNQEANKTALYWKLAFACLVWFLGNFAYAHLSQGAYKTGDLYSSFNDEYGKLRGDFEAKWQTYQKDKQAVVTRITGEKPTLASCEKWRPPFDTAYNKLLKAVRDRNNNSDRYDDSPHYPDDKTPTPAEHTGETQKRIDELNRAIAYYQGQMDKYKRKLDELQAMINIGATGGNIKAQYDEAMANYKKNQNLRDDAKKKIDRLTKSPTTIDDLSNPWHYSRDKNPWGSGSTPPSLKLPSKSNQNGNSLLGPSIMQKYPHIFNQQSK